MCVVSLMATAVTLGTVLADVLITAAVGAAVAGGVVSTVSGVQQAENQKQQADYQAEVAEANARLAERQAERIDLQADQRRAALSLESQQKTGSARAGFAANGVVLGAGTVLDYEADVAQTYDLDLANLNYDVENQKWQAKVHGANNQAQAAAYRSTASAYNQQKTSTAIGGAIGTIGDAASTAVSALSLGANLTGVTPFASGTAASGSGTDVVVKPGKFGWGEGI